MRAGDLLPHPKNWRQHPAEQKAAMAGLLKQIGYADALLARELPGGGLQLINGHLRRETTPDQIVPVLIVDLDDGETDLLLASHDAIALHARTDGDMLDELLAGLAIGDQALQDLLSQTVFDGRQKIAAPAAAIDDAGDELDNVSGRTLAAAIADDDDGHMDEIEIPKNLAVPQSYSVIVQCRDEADQREIFERMMDEGRHCRVMTL